MKAAIPFLIILLAIVATSLAIAGPSGIPHLKGLESALERQREDNGRMEGYVTGLQSEIHALKHEERALEKKARDELGMAREDELIIFFERRSE